MKKLVLMLMVLFASSASADALQVNPENSEEFEVSTEGPFSFIDNDWIEVDLLHRGPSGQHEIELKAEETGNHATSWTCPYCEGASSFHRRTCESYGKYSIEK